jgi:phage terminase large subunit-like protein
MITEDQIQQWKQDPVAFVREVLRDPETELPFDLYPEEEIFIREALTLTPEGRLPYAELVFSAPKKSGKTALAAMIAIDVIVVLGGRYAEGYCLANDLDQSTGRVFQAVSRIIQASPLLKDCAKLYTEEIEFPSTGATIQALASDYTGAAGGNPTISVFDELWGYTSERSVRLWDEHVCPPTRKIACRLTVTYAGFEGESELLEKLIKRGKKGEEIAPDLYAQPGSMLMYLTHECRAPWQTAAWKEQMREQLRKNAYTRMIENKFVSSESDFVEPEWWAACVNADLTPILADRGLSVWAGVDASVKRDSTAIVGCAYDYAAKKVRLVCHRKFQPTQKDPLNFEATIEAELLDMHRRYRLVEVRYDPYQMVSSARRLTAAGVPMLEFPQSVPNLTEASSNLYELIKGRNLVVYPDEEITLAVNRAVAIETSRGWRIAKEKASHKIDLVVALAQAALGAARGGAVPASSLKDGHLALGPLRELPMNSVNWSKEIF